MESTSDDMFWLKYNSALGNYCRKVSFKTIDQKESIYLGINEGGIDWTGSMSFAFWLTKHYQLNEDNKNLEQSLQRLNEKLKYQEERSKDLIDQLKEMNKFSQERQWKLQENLVHTEYSLQVQMDTNNVLQQKIDELETKLMESELLLNQYTQNQNITKEKEFKKTSKIRLTNRENNSQQTDVNTNKSNNTNHLSMYI